MLARIKFLWVLLGVVLGCSVALSSVLVDAREVAPTNRVQPASPSATSPPDAAEEEHAQTVARAVAEPRCAPDYTGNCSTPPPTPPPPVDESIAITDVVARCDSDTPSYLVTVTGTSAKPAVLVEVFDGGGPPGRATLPVTNGLFGGTVTVAAAPADDGGTLLAVSHIPDPFEALTSASIDYTPCPELPPAVCSVSATTTRSYVDIVDGRNDSARVRLDATTTFTVTGCDPGGVQFRYLSNPVRLTTSDSGAPASFTHLAIGVNFCEFTDRSLLDPTTIGFFTYGDVTGLDANGQPSGAPVDLEIAPTHDECRFLAD